MLDGEERESRRKKNQKVSRLDINFLRVKFSHRKYFRISRAEKFPDFTKNREEKKIIRERKKV